AEYLDGEELDRLPEPAWDLVPDFPLRFQPNVFNYRATPVASVVTSRGCPFSCTFCDRSTSGRRGRFHGVEYVVAMCRRLERHRGLAVGKHEVKIPRRRETLRQTRAAGIRVKGLLMMAHPTEDEASLAETVDFLRRAPLDLAQVTKFTPYPGTPSYVTVRQHGAFAEDWERMNAMNWVFVPHGLTAEVLERYFRRAYRVFYTRPDLPSGP